MHKSKSKTRKKSSGSKTARFRYPKKLFTTKKKKATKVIATDKKKNEKKAIRAITQEEIEVVEVTDNGVFTKKVVVDKHEFTHEEIAAIEISDNEYPEPTYEDEEWKPFPNKHLKTVYSVSNYGRLKNILTDHIHQPGNRSGYVSYCLTHPITKKRISYKIHIVVAKLFVNNPDPDKNKIVNHKDGRKYNNHYTNLEWTTSSENTQHAVDMGLIPVTKRRIGQYEGDKLIKEYDSGIAVAKAFDVNSGRVTDACKGRRVCENLSGYSWKYLDHNPNEQANIDLSKFKQVRTYPNYYVNENGDVYSKRGKKFLSAYPHPDGSVQVQLSKRKEGGAEQKKSILIHNLVAIYFLKRPKNAKVNCIRHIDGNKKNNNIKNLKWTYIGGVHADFNV